MHSLLVPVYIGVTVSVFLTKLPYWLLKYSLFPSTRAKPKWTLPQQLLVLALRTWLRTVTTIGGTLSRDPDAPLVLADTLKHSHPVELKALSRAWFRGIIETAANDVGGLGEVLKNGTGKVGPRRIPAYWYSGTKAGKNDELVPLTNSDEDLVVLYFHGGAYIIGSAHEQDSASAICRDFVDKTPAKRVLSVDYRLAGLAPFPAALIDALTGYHYLTQVCKIPASRIVFSGDSAGANLALALMRYIRDEGANLPTPLEMPAASVLLSPWCDLSESHHGVGKSGDVNANSDYVDAHFGNKGIEGLLRGHSRTMRYNPYVSPGSRYNTDPKSFEGFPPSFIHACGGEAILDDITFLREKMVESLGQSKVEFDIAPDAPHDVLLFAKWGPTREASVDNINKWLAKQFPQAAKSKASARSGDAKKQA